MSGQDLNDTKQIHVKLTSALHKRLKIRAAVHDTTIQEYVVKALDSWISKDELSGTGTKHEEER